MLVMLAAGGAVYGTTASSAFDWRTLDITGETFSSEDRARATLALVGGENLFALRTEDLVAKLEALPTVVGATVSVELPDTLRVVVHERRPILVWAVAARRFAVDADGVLFAERSALTPDAQQAIATLPVVEDRRRSAGDLTVGSTLDPVDLDASTRLAALTPPDLGSTAPSLQLRVDDDQGFVMRAQPDGWTAVFGFYTPALRTTELIPGQVRLLRSLLAGREPSVARVVLADDRNGTYIPRGNARASASATPQPRPPNAKPSP